MDLILNQIAIWRACRATTLNIKNVPAGRQVRRAGNATFETTEKLCKRYAKDYDKSGVQFCLMVFSDINDEKSVETQLDAVAKKITKKEALEASINSTSTDFKYLTNTLKEKQ